MPPDNRRSRSSDLDTRARQRRLSKFVRRAGGTTAPTSAGDGIDLTSNDVKRDSSDPGSGTEPEEEASKDEPEASDTIQQPDEPEHKNDTREEAEPQQPAITTSSKEEVQLQQSPEETHTRQFRPEKPKPRLIMTDKDARKYWFDQSNMHRDEVKKLQKSIANLQKNFSEERIRLESTREELFQEKTQLKKRLDTLQTSHIQSVNSVGTGLEPISDQTFEDRFRALQDEVNVWCRKLFKRKGQICALEELHENPKAMICGRVYSHDMLTFPHLMELVAWAFMEEHIFSTWFPGLPEDLANQMTELQSWIRPGDNRIPEKAEYWRTYTKSLLFQNPRARDCIQDVLPLSTHLLDHLLAVQVGKNNPVKEYMEAVQKSLLNARILAADLGCQRGVYEIDDDINVGDRYDDSRMTDAMFTAEVGDRVVVYCILSKGWVKRAYTGAKKIDVRICKAKVLVTTARQSRS